MQDGAYGTVEVPAAPKKKGSLKRLVASAAAVSLALGFAAVTAVDHGLMSFSSEPYVQIKLSGTSFCLGVLDRKNADSKSKLIIYQCDSKMKGQAFQMVPVGGGYNIKYDTKNGGSSVDRTLCVNNPSKGGTLQLYQCKSGDPNSLWYYKNGKLVSDKDDACMATAVPPGQSSLSNSDYVDATWCGNEYTKWNVPTCVEITQCVGCTRQFFTKSFLGDDACVLVRSSGEDPASPRHRAGVASMAWRTTR